MSEKEDEGRAAPAPSEEKPADAQTSDAPPAEDASRAAPPVKDEGRDVQTVHPQAAKDESLDAKDVTRDAEAVSRDAETASPDAEGASREAEAVSREAAGGQRPRRKWLTTAAIIVGFSLLTALLEWTGWLGGVETRALDTLVSFRQSFSARPPSPITIVEIGEDDYKAIFHETSPLDPGGVMKLVEAVAAARPALVCVDIPTAGERYRDFEEPAGSTIVWARDTPESEVEGGSHGVGVEKLEPVLGREEAGALKTGVPQFPPPEDGLARYYWRTVGGRDTLNWAATRALCRQGAGADFRERCSEILREGEARNEGHGGAHAERQAEAHVEEEDEYLLHLTGDGSNFERVPALAVLTAHFGPDKSVQEKLRGRVVMLGGRFGVARDNYPTPLGTMPGVVLTAQAVEAELRGLGLKRPGEGLILLSNVLLGVVSMFSFILLKFWRGLLTGIGLTLFAALLLSWLVFGSLVYMLYFVPLLLAMLGHHTYQHLHAGVHDEAHKAVGPAHGGDDGRHATAAEAPTKDESVALVDEKVTSEDESVASGQ